MNTRRVMKTVMLTLLFSTLGSLGVSREAQSQTLAARLFTVAPHNDIRMASGSVNWCVNVEPIGGNFQLTDINLCTVVLISPGTGSVSQIPYDCNHSTLIADQDFNGVQDIRFCFLKTAMAPLFDNLHGRKPKTVTLTVQGNLYTGQSFSGNITMQLYLQD